MGFIRGVIAGITMAAGAAAWYMSRAGSKFRDRYRVDRKLGEIGDEVELRTRDVRAQVGSQVGSQVAAARDRVTERVTGGSNDVATKLDEAQAAAAEEAAGIAADVEAKAAKVKKAAKSAEADAEG
jgi:hypothetical protein